MAERKNPNKEGVSGNLRREAGLQDDSAAPTVSKYMNELVNSQDLIEIIDSQNSILGRFEKTNETLTRVNSLSEIRFEVISRDFRKHIITLLEMKQNLDIVFKRIRSLRNTTRAKFPEAYKECEVTWVPPDDDENEEQEASLTSQGDT